MPRISEASGLPSPPVALAAPADSDSYSQRSTSTNGTMARKFSTGSTYTTSSIASSSSPEASQADWSLTRYYKASRLTFTAEQERIYYEERLGPAALITLSHGYSLGIVIMMAEILLAVMREQNVLAVYASVAALVCNIVGLASVKWNGGKLFLRWYTGSGDSTEQAKDSKTKIADEKGLQPPDPVSNNHLRKPSSASIRPPVHNNHSRKPSSASTNYFASPPYEASVVKSAAPKPKGKRILGLRTRRFVILTPLALFFLALLVLSDLHSLEEAMSVTGSSYSYIVLLSAAAMGVIFTHPLVWYPMSLAALAVLFRCGLIMWSIFAIYTSGKMPLVAYGPTSAAVTTSAPKITAPAIRPGPIPTRRPISPIAVTTSSPLNSLVETIPELEKRNDESKPEADVWEGLRKRSEEKSHSHNLAKRNLFNVLNRSISGRERFAPPAEFNAPFRKVSAPLALLAALGGVIMYLSSSIVGVAVALRFAKSNERGHRVRFIQTKVVQQDRDRLTRERDRSARLLAIVFPKPVISNLLSLWAKNNRETNDSDAVLQNQEDIPTGTGTNESANNLEFADRINNVVVAFVDFYTADVFAGIGGQDGVQDKCKNSRAHARRAVALLNLTFEKFDAILEKYPGIEKIKTIGTKVMIAGGLFDSKADDIASDSGPHSHGTMSKTGVIDRPAINPKVAAAELTLLMLRLALETRDTMNSYDPGELDECFEYEAENNDGVPCTCAEFNLNITTPRCVRFGIATGTVVAGIVGLERFCLDLWGDSVNTASRMLSVAAKNEVVVTDEVRGGFQYLQTGKMAKVLGMVGVRDDFLFESLGTRDIKGKGPMELFYVTNPWYVNYSTTGTQNPAPSPPTLAHTASRRAKPTSGSPRPRAKAPRKKRINATADLVSAALGLAKDAQKSKAEAAGNDMEECNPTCLLRNSLIEIRKFKNSSAEGSTRQSYLPGTPNEISHSPKSPPPNEVRSPNIQENMETAGEKSFQSEKNLRIAVGKSQQHNSSQQLDSATRKESVSATYDYLSDLGLANEQYAQKGGNGRTLTKGQRLSLVIADLSPANDYEAAESRNTRVGIPQAGSVDNDVGINRDLIQYDTQLSNVISDILNDFLSLPTSELSYDRQFSKLSAHLHKWLLRFKDPRMERKYRSVQTSERKSLELLWDGCLASLIAFVIASAEIFIGGPPSVTLDVRLKLIIPASKPTLGYWIAAAGLVVHILVAVMMSWDSYKRQRCNKFRKTRDLWKAIMNPGDDSGATNRISGLATPVPIGSSFPAPDPTPCPFARLPSALRIAVYHVATLSFFLTVTSLLIDTPIGDRTWFAPALLVTCAFYAVQLDIGAPSFIRASLWTAFLLMVSCAVLFLSHRMTEVDALVIASFGFLAFLMLARATQRARRTGFLLRVVVDKQKSLSAGEARRSAQLLMSILPERILRRVIDNPRAMVVEEFAAVTFLHLDIVDFTALSAALAPDAVVSLLNVLFTKFDEVCRQYGVEKMTTIGDAYVAFGLSESAMEAAEAGFSSDVDEEYVPIALATCKAALELQRVVDEFNKSEFAENLLRPSGKSGVRVRVAVHTGRGHGCVLGGTTRLKYEFVGEAIRVAERVQEKTPKGQACVSEASVRKMGPEALQILQNGRGFIDGIYMEVEQDQVDGMNYFVMTKPNR